MNITIIILNCDELNGKVYTMLAGARSMKRQQDKLCCWSICNDEKVDTFISMAGFDKVIIVKDEEHLDKHSEQFIELLEELHKKEGGTLYILPSDEIGHPCSVRLAERIQSEAICNCTAVEIEAHKFIVKKLVYASNLSGIYEVEQKGLIVTLVDDSYTYAEKSMKSLHILQEAWKFKPLEWLKYSHKEEKNKNRLHQCSTVIACGRGVKNKDDLEMFERLANQLHGVVACSRPLLQKGWFGAERLIGQSGNRIHIEKCLVVGVSGASPFLVGLKNVKTIIAINQDEYARIFEGADIGIASSYQSIMPQLIEKFEEVK